MIQFGKLKIGTDEVALERARGESEAAVAKAEADAEYNRSWAQQEKEEAAEADRIAKMTFSDEQIHNVELLSTFLEHYCANGFGCEGRCEDYCKYDFKMYSSCKSKLEAFFSVEENKQKYQNQYIKFLEIKALHKITNFKSGHFEKYGEVSFENYGQATKLVQKEVQKMLQEGSSSSGAYSISGTQAASPNIVYVPQTGPKKFWKDWGTGKKVGYVILNIYTFCIPVIIHVIVFFVQRALNKSDNKTAGTENQ